MSNQSRVGHTEPEEVRGRRRSEIPNKPDMRWSGPGASVALPELSRRSAERRPSTAHAGPHATAALLGRHRPCLWGCTSAACEWSQAPLVPRRGEGGAFPLSGEVLIQSLVAVCAAAHAVHCPGHGTSGSGRPFFCTWLRRGQCPRASPKPMGKIVRLKPHGAIRREATALRRHRTRPRLVSPVQPGLLPVRLTTPAAGRETACRDTASRNAVPRTHGGRPELPAQFRPPSVRHVRPCRCLPLPVATSTCC